MRGPQIHMVVLFSSLALNSVFPVISSAAQSDITENQEFISSVDADHGVREILATPDRIIFSGRVPKYKTSDPRSLGGARFLINLSNMEYRVVSFAYLLDETGLQANQSAETDIGLTITPKAQLVSLNSGEELLVTHQCDASNNYRRVAKVSIPSGGFALRPNQRLSVGSVSSIFSQSAGGAQVVDDARIADGRFVSVFYKVELVRADLVSQNAVTTYRSPYRDRSYVADPHRVDAPSSDFKNTSNKAVHIYGIGVFIGDAPDSPATNHDAIVYLNDRPLKKFHFAQHQPGIASEPLAMILPFSYTMKPNDVISVVGQIVPPQAVVFDFASYLVADVGLTLTNEKLDMTKVDLNRDGFPDIIDIDSAGSVWVSLTASGGLQNTQLEWARDLNTVEKLAASPDSGEGVVLRATNSHGLCLNLHGDVSRALFVPSYCGDSPKAQDAEDIWGDFNGDGWIDRMRISVDPDIYFVALGGAAGLGKEQAWAYGGGSVDRMFVSRRRNESNSSIEAESNESNAFHCVIWRSTGSSFVKSPCKQ